MSYDVFISYRHTTKDTARKLEEELKSRGLEVFRDESEIATFESILARVAEGLANSKVCAVVASEDYGESRKCMWELTASYLAAKRDPIGFRRLCLLKPPTVDPKKLTFLPPELKDGSYAYSPEAAAQGLAERLDQIEGVFGMVAGMGFTQPYGITITSSSRFTGRASVFWDIHGKMNLGDFPMAGGGAGPRIAQLTGMGGTGKTLAAQEYALRFNAAYPGGVFWLQAQGSYNPDQGDIGGFKERRLEEFKKAGKQLGLVFDEKIEFGVLRSLIGEKLRTNGKIALWVVDDMPSDLAAQGHEAEARLWISPDSNARTLMTSRSQEYEDFGGHIPLEQLDEGEALELLKFNGVELTDLDAARVLINRLGGHALAVDVAGAELKKFGDPIRTYLGKIDRNAALINDTPLIKKALPGGHSANIVATIVSSLQRLSDAELDFLRLAAHLSPAPIKIELMAFVSVIADSLEPDKADSLARIRILACDCLSLCRGSGYSRTVHALVGDVMRYKGYTDDERGRKIREAAITALWNIIDHEKNYDYFKYIADEVEHARHITNNIVDPGSSFNLLAKLALFDFYRGNLSRALAEQIIVLDLSSKFQGNENIETLNSKNNLAGVYLKLGKPEKAVELFSEVLETRKRLFSSDEQEIVTTKGNLALALVQIGDLVVAKRLQLEALEFYQSSLSPDDDRISTAKNNLASTLKAMGDFKTALNLQTEALEASQRTKGPEDHSTLTYMHNLASTLKGLERHHEALQLYAISWEGRHKALGPEHQETLTSANDYAWQLVILGRTDEAKVIYENTLVAYKNTLPPGHPDTLRTMSNYANTLLIMGMTKDAIGVQEEVLENSKHLGHKNPITTIYTWVLYTIYERAGKNKLAKRLLNQNLSWLIEDGVVLHDMNQRQIAEEVRRQLTK